MPSDAQRLPNQPPRLVVPSYSIYAITRKEDGKTYVGLTRRSIQGRVAAHVRDAMRTNKRSRPGSLASAIRQVLICGHRFETAFRVTALARGLGPDEARDAEILWVERLETYAPKGFNLLPAGASIGGPGNARPTPVHHPRHGLVTYPSLYAAIHSRNDELLAAGRSQLEIGTVYARLMMGWSVEEALDYEQHVDGRSLRRPFFSEGVVLRRLREVSEATGLDISTLRSRLHRAARCGIVVPEIQEDRRRAATGLLSPILLPDPAGLAVGRTCSIKEFAARSGIAKATVAYRYHQLTAPDAMDDRDLVAHLTTSQDRRRLLVLTLPDGRTIEGGEREVIRSVLTDRQLAWGRPERLSESGIRRRLRMCPDNSGVAIEWAFGFAPSAQSAADRSTAAEDTEERDGHFE